MKRVICGLLSAALAVSLFLSVPMVAEYFGYTVSWDSATRTVVIE